jgi:drug/metabolite transporter (DMT)-like permease
MAHACSKLLLLLLNVLLITLGIALIVLSFYIYEEYHYGHLIIGVIVLAFIVAFIGLLGLIGVLKKSKCGKSHLFIPLIIIFFALFSVIHLSHPGRFDHLGTGDSTVGHGSSTGMVRRSTGQ